MTGAKRSNLFLLELVFSVFLFTLCTAVCVGLLLYARSMSMESTRLTQAVYLAQSTAEAFRAGQPDSLPDAPEGYEVTPMLQLADGLVEGEIVVSCEGETVYTLEVAFPDDSSWTDGTFKVVNGQ